jgi:phosphatidylinositol alpha-mannosyltransferase
MKIGIVCPYNIFKPGGVQQHVQNQAAVLRSHGHSVIIITPRPYQHYDTEAPEGVIFLGRSARVKAPHATSADVSVTVENEAVETMLDREQFDILHVHEPLVPVMPRQILKKASCLRVGTFHAALPGNMLGKSLSPSYKAYGRSVLPHIDVITAVSPAAVGYIEDSIHDSQKIHFIPNGINLVDFRPSGKHVRLNDEVLFIGRLEKRKGAKQLLQAFSVLVGRRPATHLTIAGDGPSRDSLEKYVIDNNIPNVTFLGYIDDSRKRELLETTTVYTSPALYGESFGIVLVEAMALAAPIVAHINDGYSWVLKGTGRLSLADCKDQEEYAAKLELMLEDQGLRRVWQEWAKKYIKQFDYNNVVAQYEELYETYVKE